MSEFINYILYGFYQIDYIFGVRRYPHYNIGTGGVLFSLSVSIYFYSAVLLIVGGGAQCGLFNSLSMSIVEILFVVTGVVVGLWWYYWLDREKYKTTFEKLDNEPSVIRWVCFILALIWGFCGILFMYKCILYLHKLMIIV